MTNYIASLLTNRLLKYGLISFCDKEVYNYSIQVYLEHIIGVSVVLAASVLYKFFVQTILFLIFFSCLRKYSGGFHAKSFLGCLFYSLLIYMFYVETLYPILLAELWINIIYMLLGLLIILVIGSVNHPYMHWSVKEYRLSKHMTRKVAVIETVCILVFYLLGMENSYILFMPFGIILDAVMLLLTNVIRQEVN